MLRFLPIPLLIHHTQSIIIIIIIIRFLIQRREGAPILLLPFVVATSNVLTHRDSFL